MGFICELWRGSRTEGDASTGGEAAESRSTRRKRRGIMSRKRLGVFVSVICVLGFLGTAWGGEKPIAIGVPGTFTGPYAADGLYGKQGVILATEEINSRGGIFGRKLKLHYYDVEDLVPEKVMASAERLVVGKKVDLVITSWVDYGVDVKAYGRYDVPYFESGTELEFFRVRSHGV
jgi:branched-chain amino acid transport system substrate-binding protein